ncbi:MAG: murein biosynthesis integral membrane protein MurJ [Chloroflexota bacterium]|nr:murein biosynthesis integral membrane protein MurJ [Chloroflexota bacterium]
MTGGRSLARAGLIVTGAFLISRALGWVRLAVLGATIGATSELDTFFAAFGIPDLIFQLVAAGALSSALIPIVAGLLETGEESRAWRVASTVADLMLVILAVLAVVVFVAAPVIVGWITPGFSPAQQAQTVDLTRIMLVSPIVLALGSLATSLLNAKGRFAASAVAPIMYNLAIIGAALFLAPTYGVTGLAIGVVAGSACHLAIQLLPLRQVGFRWTPRIDLDDSAARQALILMVPRAIGLGASQLTFVVARALATTIGVGAVTAFSIAFSIFQIPIGVIGIPIGVVMLPSLSRDLARGDTARYVNLVSRALRLILWVMLPLAGLTVVLRTEIVTVLFGYGRFDQRGVDLTATVLVVLAFALASESLIAILARAFYAGRDTLTPVIAAVLAVVLNVSLSIALVGRLELAGIGLAIVVGSWAEVVYLLVVLRRRVGGFDLSGLIGSGGLALVGASIASAVAWAVLNLAERLVGSAPPRPVLLVEVALIAGLSGLAYLGFSRALRIEELGTIVRLMSDALRRPAAS